MGLIAVAIVVLLYVALGLYLRYLANKRDAAGRPDPTIAAIIPGGMHAIVTRQRNAVANTSFGGGSIVDLIHAVPGMKMNKRSHDARNWYYVPGREWRGLFYRIFDVQIIGPLRYLRLTVVRTFRFSRKNGESKYEIQPKDEETRFIHFQGQLDMLFESVETKGIFRVNIPINLLYDKIYPVRVELTTADAFAELMLFAQRIVVAEAGGHQPEDLIQKKAVQDNFAKAIMDGIKTHALQELGIGSRLVTFGGIDYDEESRKILEELPKAQRLGAAAVEKAKQEGEAAYQLAEGQKRAQLERNAADRDRVGIFTDLAKDPVAAHLFEFDRGAQAYEKQTAVTVYAPGSNHLLPLPVEKSE